MCTGHRNLKSLRGRPSQNKWIFPNFRNKQQAKALFLSNSSLLSNTETGPSTSSPEAQRLFVEIPSWRTSCAEAVQVLRNRFCRGSFLAMAPLLASNLCLTKQTAFSRTTSSLQQCRKIRKTVFSVDGLEMRPLKPWRKCHKNRYTYTESYMLGGYDVFGVCWQQWPGESRPHPFRLCFVRTIQRVNVP